jgi:large conductance mechanosensitive channel
MKDFKEFVVRGNVVDLAVGIVVGAAFGGLVTAFVAAFISPLVALVAGTTDIASLTFTVGSSGTIFPYGLFLAALISFVLVALAIFFLVVKPINALRERQRRGEPVDPTSKPCPECLSEIPMGARRCAFCTSEQPAAA